MIDHRLRVVRSGDDERGVHPTRGKALAEQSRRKMLHNVDEGGGRMRMASRIGAVMLLAAAAAACGGGDGDGDAGCGAMAYTRVEPQGCLRLGVCDEAQGCKEVGSGFGPCVPKTWLLLAVDVAAEVQSTTPALYVGDPLEV